MKKIFLYLSLLIALFVAVFIARNQAGHDLVVLFTHDLHSNLEEFNMPVGNDSVITSGGYARLSTAIQNERKGKEDNSIVVDAGDFSMGTLFHTIRAKVSPELVTMGAMGYDITTFGNHDFEFGPDQLAQALRAAKKHSTGKLPGIVASNTVVNPNDASLASLSQAFAEYPVLPYKVMKRAGMKIGFFGLMGKDAAIYVPEAKPVVFSDYIEVAAKTVDILRHKEKVDLIICLSHSGTWKDKTISEDEILAGKVPDIDVIISGHTHTILDPYIQVGKTYIVSAGAYGRYLGRLEIIEKSSHKFQALNYKLIPVSSVLPKDPKISSLVDSLKEEIENEYLSLFNYRYGQVLTQSNISLLDFDWDTGSREKLVRSGLGDLVTDAFVYAVEKTEGEDYRKISLALVGFGQIRVPLAQGTVTINDMFRLLAIGRGVDGLSGSSLVTFWLTGKEIKQILELETTLADVKDDLHLQISGMRFSYDPKAPAFERIKAVEVEIADGKIKPLEENCLYRVCTNWKTILMAENIKQLSAGKIVFTPKDEAGMPIVDLGSSRVFINPHSPVELKEWVAMAIYLESFSEVPLQYRRPRNQVIMLQE